LEDSARCGVQVMPTSRAIPRLATLFSRVPLEYPLLFALRAIGVFAVRCVAGAPKPLKASLIIRVLAQELHKRLLRFRRCCSFGIVAVYWCHTYIVLGLTSPVKV